MLEIKNKKDCCGCNACVQICPKQCIEIKVDYEGFEYPCVSVDSCIDCGLCEKVCPIVNTENSRVPLRVYAAKHVDATIKLKSSSGGFFFALAKKVLDDGGVVFGAAFDEDRSVHHVYTEKIEGLWPILGSKYVQSRIGTCFFEAKRFLDQGRLVLFSGCPCQIAGLKKYLRNKQYSNLILVDFLCHGVPSPGVWGKYLEEILKKIARRADSGENSVLKLPLNAISAIDISFRDKEKYGWRKYSFVVRGMSSSKDIQNSVLLSDMHRDNPFMKGFLSNLYLRPSCHFCKFKRFQSGSDITLGDYWGIYRVNPSFNDNEGVSMVFINTSKAAELLLSIKDNLELAETSFQDTLSNKGLDEAVIAHPKRYFFFKRYRQNKESIVSSINASLKQPIVLILAKKIINRIKC